MHSALITPQNLRDLLDRQDVKILDATYGVPGFPGSVLKNMEAGRIGQAQFFDIDAVADISSPYPHTLPDAVQFATCVGALGIGNDDTIVVYDQTGISFAAARVWWMFRVFGHNNVLVLNGGLPAWRAQGLPLQTGPIETPAPKAFKAVFQPALFRDFEQMEDGGDTILDARAAARFNATMHTLDGDTVPAHIEGAHNVPMTDLLDHTGALRPAVDLSARLEGFLKADRIVCSCGSGVTACVVALALHEAGRSDTAVYDGSWTEWADRNHLRA